MIKKYLSAFFILITLLSFTGCAESETLSNTNMIGIGTEVYVEEGTNKVPYIIVSENYNGNVLLLRKYILEHDMRMNEYYAYYEECEVDNYLNEQFYSALPEKTQKYIINTPIEVVDNDYYNSGIHIKQIDRKVFLLSFRELNQAYNYHSGKEGEAIEYFNSDNAFLASTDENQNNTSWWLRSVDTSYQSCFYAVSFNGKIGSTDAWRKNGIRPAFCVESDAIISDKDGNYSLKE